MHEAEKLQDAEYHYSLIIDPDESGHFRQHLRALLGSARSVLQYAFKETEPNPTGKAWYERNVQDPVIAFLREERNDDVHERPAATSQTIGLMPAELTITGGGAAHQTVHSRLPPSTTHRFAKWPGPEDVPTLCRLYLDRLKLFIEDGQRHGYLTK